MFETAPIFVFFDTNTWIYLSNGYDIFSQKYGNLHLKAFEIIQRRVKDGSLVILVNDIIFEEWERNIKYTTEHINKIEERLTHSHNCLHQIAEFIEGSQAELSSLSTAIDEAAKRKIELQRQHIAHVSDLLKNNTDRIEVLDTHRIEASKMAQAKQAPFKGEKSNSMSDALILLSAVDFLDPGKVTRHPALDFARANTSQVESFFISSNIGDFAASKKEPHTIHPDLVNIFARSGTDYHPSLAQLIFKLEETFLTQDELRAMEEASQWIYCQACDQEEPTVRFGSSMILFDPYKVPFCVDRTQLSLFGEQNGIQKAKYDRPYSDVTPAWCEYCSADYLQCPNCNELVELNVNEVSNCPGCHYKFLLSVKRGRKGDIEELEYEIVERVTCQQCGKVVEAINDDDLCDTCANYNFQAEYAHDH